MGRNNRKHLFFSRHTTEKENKIQDLSPIKNNFVFLHQPLPIVSSTQFLGPFAGDKKKSSPPPSFPPRLLYHLQMTSY